MDALVAQAREAHRQACDHTFNAEHFRRLRDDLIRQAYDTKHYSYSTLAHQVGVSPELVAKVIQGRH